MSRIISYQTYKDFAERYSISLFNRNGTKKDMKKLQKEIYEYEKKNINRNGLYIL